MDQQKALIALKRINTLLEVYNPALGAAVDLGVMLVQLLKGLGAPTGDFATEIARFDAQIAKGFAVDDAWRKEHGLPPV